MYCSVCLNFRTQCVGKQCVGKHCGTFNYIFMQSLPCPTCSPPIASCTVGLLKLPHAVRYFQLHSHAEFALSYLLAADSVVYCRLASTSASTASVSTASASSAALSTCVFCSISTFIDDAHLPTSNAPPPPHPPASFGRKGSSVNDLLTLASEHVSTFKW